MRWLMTAILLLLVAALALGWRQLRQPQPPLRLALDPWPSNELLWLAQERGLFRDEGVDLRLVELGSAGDSTMAFNRGKVDLFVCTPAELVRMVGGSGPQPRVLLALDWSDGADVLLAREAVTSVAALKGRTVAYEPGGLGAHMLQRALESARLGWTDITTRPMAVASMNEAFTRGEVDAVVSYPPWSVILGKTSGIRTLYDSRSIPGEISDLLVAHPDVLLRAPDLPDRLVRIWGGALRLLDQDAQALAQMAAHEQLAPAEFGGSLREGIHLLRADEQPGFLAAGGPLVDILGRVRVSMRNAGEMIGPGDPASCLLPPPASGVGR